MSINPRLRWFLDSHHIDYEVVPHRHCERMLDSARAARVPEGLVAKCVLLEDVRGYMLAVIPASCRVDLGNLERQIGRHLELASEDEVEDLFFDCERGAIPPLGFAFVIPTVIDESLLRVPDVYFEEGDHSGLVHVSGRDFRDLDWPLHFRHVGRPH